MVLRNSALKKLVRKPGYQGVTLGELIRINFLYLKWLLASGLAFTKSNEMYLNQFSYVYLQLLFFDCSDIPVLRTLLVPLFLSFAAALYSLLVLDLSKV